MNSVKLNLLDAISNHNPAAPALHDGVTQQLNYGQLQTEVKKVKTWLDRHALTGVAILADNSPAHVILDLACLATGCWSLSIPPFFTKAQQTHARSQCGCCYVLTDQFSDSCIDKILIAGSTFYLNYSPVESDIQPRSVLPAQTRKITFTSGSTGTPRGLCLSEEQLTAPAIAISEAMKPLTLKRHLSLLPLSILLENVAGIYAALIAGIECTVPSLARTGVLDDPAHCGGKLVECLQKHRINSAIVVPELLAAIVDHATKTARTPSSMRYLAVGGSHVCPQLLTSAKHLGIPVYEGYGLSEAGSVVAVNLPGQHRAGTVGQVLPHQAVHVADDGELILKQRGFLAYCDERPDDSQSTPQCDFPTGDLGCIDEDGFLIINGRKKNVLITSMGRNVSPEWIEALLTNNAQITQALVHGDAQRSLEALVVSNCPPTELKRTIMSVNATLPEYARIHTWQVIAPMTVANGQLTGNGKMRRAVVIKHYNQQYTGPIQGAA